MLKKIEVESTSIHLCLFFSHLEQSIKPPIINQYKALHVNDYSPFAIKSSYAATPIANTSVNFSICASTQPRRWS